MLMKPLIVTLAALLSIAGYAFADTASLKGAQVYIISPMDGETVTSPVTVKFGLRGMGSRPGGH